jgi:hypothetical protein
MSEFAGAYGDKRRAAAMARLYDAVVEQNSLVIRKLCVAAHRVRSSPRVTPTETLGCLTSRTAQARPVTATIVSNQRPASSFTHRCC